MEKNLLRLFQTEVEHQCTYALIAVEDIQDYLNMMATMELDLEVREKLRDRVWYSIQDLLVSCGDISKILWPDVSVIPDRGKEVRESLSVPEHSPLEVKNFKIHFEFFDKRLEEWALSSKRRNFIDQNIGRLNECKGSDLGDVIRNFDPETWTLHFHGDKHELLPIIQAVIELEKKALIEVNTPL